MRTSHLKNLTAAALISGIPALIYLILIPLDPARGQIINYGVLRLILIALMGLLLVLLAGGWFKFQTDDAWGKQAASRVDEMLAGNAQRLFGLRFALLISIILLAEGYLLTWFTLPIPLRPLILWMAVVCILMRAALGAAYRAIISKRQNIYGRIKEGWQNWTDTQRKVFIILLVLGAVYFAAFIPVNYHSGMHPDEEVIYPDVVNMLIPGSTFTETLQDSFIISSWWYGYPYFPLSALTLVIPRLIYGNAFAGQTALNLLLMRQFISVLPMAASIILLIYLVNGFKHLWASIGMFIVLGLIPGVVHYNIRFWHPDAIIVFLVLLTVWLLKRDRLRFGRDFYLAAFAVGLNAVIKVWGLFFFLAVGGYLLAGLITKKLDTRQDDQSRAVLYAGHARVDHYHQPVHHHPLEPENLHRRASGILSGHAAGLRRAGSPGRLPAGAAGLDGFFQNAFHAGSLLLFCVFFTGGRFFGRNAKNAQPAYFGVVPGHGRLPGGLDRGEILPVPAAADDPAVRCCFSFPGHRGRAGVPQSAALPGASQSQTCPDRDHGRSDGHPVLFQYQAFPQV